MSAQRWHLLDYFVAFIRHSGGIQFYRGGLKEGSHKLLKTVYAKSSKYRVPALDEAVRRYTEKMQNDHLLGRSGEQWARHKSVQIYMLWYTTVK